MAGANGRRGGGDRVLESRHLVGLFLGVVLLCAVFFTLGYVMGRTQYGGPVQAAGTFIKDLSSPTIAAKAKQPATLAAPANGEWDFYTRKDDSHLAPVAAAPAPAPAPAPTTVPAVAKKTTGAPPPAVTKPVAATSKPAEQRFQPPKMRAGAIVLQIAAMKREGDALALADAIQQKKFPSFVVTPGSDNLYHVQVGPYADLQSAESAKHALEQSGFKAIIKR
jgi:DedD protein